MSKRAMMNAGLGLLGLLAIACSDGDDDGPGKSTSSATGANPSNDSAATGMKPAIEIGGANSGRAGGGGAGPDGGAGTGAAGSAGDNNAGSGNGGAGAGGAGANGAGAGGNAGNAGNAGTGSGGTSLPGMGGTTGNGNCDLVCPLGTRCDLVDVTCIQAPCNPVPQCVAVGSGGRGGNGSGGFSGTEGSGDGAICGTRGAPPCASGEFCNHPIGADCGRADEPGTCEEMPGACTREFVPVCGCDGRTYSNACTAASAGVSIERDGEC